MRILFTRHGESEANIQHIISNRSLPHQLTPRGVDQAAALAEDLAKTATLRMIFSSPIPRAIQTAEIISKLDGIPFSVNDALREFDCGAMEGRADRVAWSAHQEVVRAWDEDHEFDRFIPPDGESFNDMKARFLPFIQDLMTNQQSPDGDILLISHGALLRQMLPLVINNIDRVFTKLHPLGNCQMIITVPENNILKCLRWDDIPF